MSLGERFIAALRGAEESGEVGPLAELFAPDAELRRMTQPQEAHPAPDAAAFWRQYLDNFGEIRSEFIAVTEGQGRAVLEWVSEGRLRAGDPVRYSGVSVLEGDGAIRVFRTYYDSAAFLPGGRKIAEGGAAEG